MVEEPCLQQPQKGMVENFESSEIGAAVCLWEKKEAIPLLLTKGAGEEHQRLTLHLNPINLDPSATAQPKNNPLPVYILPVAQFTPEAHAPKAESIPFTLPVQYFKKLVAFVQTFATTSKKMAAADVAWHSGWFECWFGFGAPEPRHIHKLR